MKFAFRQSQTNLQIESLGLILYSFSHFIAGEHKKKSSGFSALQGAMWCQWLQSFPWEGRDPVPARAKEGVFGCALPTETHRNLPVPAVP